MTRVLVAEKIGDSGVGLLREHFDVELGTDWSRDQLAERIGDYEGILIRSATKLDAELLGKASRLRAVGRAGVGVDNVDVPAATKRGIVVANAPQSNVITAAEHTMALLLALARNIPQAHASLTSGKWERSKFSGVELFEKTLGILGFGRIGQLVAQRARGFGMRVIAFDPYVGAERYRELGVEKAGILGCRLRGRRLPHAAPAEDARDRGVARRRGARQVQGRRPRAERRPRAARRRRGPAGRARFGQGRRRRARRVPLRADHRSPAVRLSERDRDAAPRRLDRRGHRPRRLPGRRAGDRGAHRWRRHQRRQRPGDPARGHGGCWARSCRCAARSGGSRSSSPAALRSTASTPSSSAGSPNTTRGCCRSTCSSAPSADTPRRRSTRSTRRRSPRSAGSGSRETKRTQVRDYTDLIRVSVFCGDDSVRVAGTLIGRRNRPHLLEAWGQRFDVQLEDHITLLRYRDVPGMIGRVGTIFGAHGVNIVSAAVGRQPDESDGAQGRLAAMAITTDTPCRKAGRGDRRRRGVRRRADRQPVSVWISAPYGGSDPTRLVALRRASGRHHAPRPTRGAAGPGAPGAAAGAGRGGDRRPCGGDQLRRPDGAARALPRRAEAAVRDRLRGGRRGRRAWRRRRRRTPGRAAGGGARPVSAATPSTPRRWPMASSRSPRA